MAFDGIVTKVITSELQNLSGARIDKIFQPDKNTILLGMYLNGLNYALNICIDSQNYSINLTTHSKPNPKIAPNFCMLLRKYLLGTHIKNFITDKLERVVIIEFEGFDEIDDIFSLKLIIELMGKHSNILLVDEQNIIIDCVRHIYHDEESNIKTRNLLPKYPYHFPISDKINFLEISNFDEFYQILETKNLSIENLSETIVNTFNGFSKSFLQNTIKILNIDNIEKENLQKFYYYITSLIYSENSSNLKFNKIYNSNNKLVDYFLEEYNYNNNKTTDNKHHIDNNTNNQSLDKNFNNNIYNNNNNDSNINTNDSNSITFKLNFFLDDYYHEKTSSEKFITYRDSLLKLILETLKKYNKRLKNINSKLQECENMDKYKLYGELITANLYRIKNQNIDSVALENYYDNNKIINIPLDKKYPPNINAKRYFKKYNKLKNTLEIVGIQKQETLNELDYIESIVYELETCSSIEEITNIYEEISENIIFKDKLPDTSKKSYGKKLKKSNLTKNKNVSFNPIKYTIDGYTIYVGRNNKENDYLTLKFANKTDLWFHTQDIHGSHVILKSENKTPSKDLLTKIASIAAFHSKGRNSSNVPVDYCEVKYVKKPNNAKPGMVIYTHQHTLVVKPSINFSK